jgi:hypothetical protein
MISSINRNKHHKILTIKILKNNVAKNLIAVGLKNPTKDLDKIINKTKKMVYPQ